MNNYKFSGHESFHCRYNWLTKGFNYPLCDNTNDNIVNLGVGANMITSIKYWLEAFGVTKNNIQTTFGKLIFDINNGFDPYLEDEGTLWLLQYKLCSQKYASIYNLFFSEYFEDKINFEFTHNKVIKFIEKHLVQENAKGVSQNVLSRDFKVLIRTYTGACKNIKTIEDDLSALLVELNLLKKIGDENADIEDSVFTLDKTKRYIPLEIFAYCVLDMYKDKESCSLSLRELKHTIGNYFCISNECLEDFLLELRTVSDIFVYNDTAGVSELAIKNNNLQIRNKLLKRHYGIHGYEMEQYIKSLENEPVAPAEVVKQYSLMF